MKSGTAWTIREARCEDVEAILNLWRQADATPSVSDTPEDLRRAIVHADTWVLLAEADSHLVGSIIGAFDAGEAASIASWSTPTIAGAGSLAPWWPP